MGFLWKYPCGCVAVGSPPQPKIEKQGLLWHSVAVVRVCDPERYFDRDGWLTPRPRVLESSGDLPQSASEKEEEEFFNFLLDMQQDAERWRSAKLLMKAVLQ